MLVCFRYYIAFYIVRLAIHMQHTSAQGLTLVPTQLNLSYSVHRMTQLKS